MDRTIESENLKKLLKEYFINNKRKLIICPFISNSTISEILESNKNDDVIIVTSWREDHLKSGVSNIELYNLAKKRNWSLFINNSLHLKLYSNDLEDAWIGSANITNKALSDEKRSNIEGLIKISNLTLLDKVLIEGIRTKSIFIDEEKYQIYKEWMDGIEIDKEDDYGSPDLKVIEVDEGFLITELPTIISPSRLYDLITEEEDPDEEWRESYAMIHDLALYEISNYENKIDLLEQLKLNFFQHPFIVSFSKQINKDGMRFGAAKEWLQNNCTSIPTPYRRELTEVTQCLFRWFEELNPDKYEIITPRYADVLRIKD